MRPKNLNVTLIMTPASIRLRCHAIHGRSHLPLMLRVRRRMVIRPLTATSWRLAF